MKLRIKHFSVLLLVFLNLDAAWATCKTEAEIPSSTPSNQFTESPDGKTVSDSKTGLMWAKCSLGQSATDCTGGPTAFNWQGALQVAEASTLAGHSDWRLPNIKELQSLIEQRCYSPSINSEVFPDTPASLFWSASPSEYNSNYAWYVSFGDGYSYPNVNRDYGMHVRLVRSGQ